MTLYSVHTGNAFSPLQEMQSPVARVLQDEWACSLCDSVAGWGQDGEAVKGVEILLLVRFMQYDLGFFDHETTFPPRPVATSPRRRP
jgi:hypothetical protein